ncbi:hypothetical protein K474DRAFT_1707773 [Panus rudis PR-1116 ss-1]|nr:hypothetical protein K474DRAFT_1707773 [Panus rudis PR-1116 ss-1]
MFWDLDDDIFIIVLAYVDLKSLLSLRQTCKRMYAISQLRIVWRNTFTKQVLERGYPYPPEALLPDIDAASLELITRRAIRLATFWLSPSAQPRLRRDYRFQSGTGISDIRLLPTLDHIHRGKKQLVTVSKGIWSEVTYWEFDLNVNPPALPRVTKWSPKGAIFTGFVVNKSPHSEGIVAISIECLGQQRIDILSLQQGSPGHGVELRPVRSIPTNYKPVLLQDDIIVFCDDTAETYVANWRTGDSAVLLSERDDTAEINFQYNKCLRVLFAYESVIVVRARSLDIFPIPILKQPEEEINVFHPLASHSFGWIDGVTVYPDMEPISSTHDIEYASECRLTDGGKVVGLPTHAPITIVVREENDDPWAADIHAINTWTLEPNAAFQPDNHPPFESAVHDVIADQEIPDEHVQNGTRVDSIPSILLESHLDSSLGSESEDAKITRIPYLFPPKHRLSTPWLRGQLRCPDITTGTQAGLRFGTCLWIQPRPPRHVDLTNYDVHSSETQGPQTIFGKYHDEHGHNQVVVFNRMESLVGVVLPGRLRRSCVLDRERNEDKESVDVRILCVLEGRDGNWTAMDYDEARGIIVLASGDGYVTLVLLA